jgi:hypothetical protein
LDLWCHAGLKISDGPQQSAVSSQQNLCGH